MTTPTWADNPINPGDTTAFEITVTNSNTAAAITNVGFVDTMPLALFVVDPVAALSCVDGQGNAVVAPVGSVNAPLRGNIITLAGATIPAAVGGNSGFCTITVKVTSLAMGTAPSNSIPINAVSGTESGSTIRNGSPALQSITVNTLNVPSIDKSFSPSTIVRSDQPTTLTFHINNPNAADLPLNDASDVHPFAFQDNFPTGMAVAPTPNQSVNCPGGANPTFSPVAGATSISAVGGAVAANASCTFKVDVVGTSTAGAFSSPKINTISASADFFNKRGLVPTSDATATLTVNSLLRVTKVFDNDPVRAGQATTMTIKLINGGSATSMSNISFTDSPIDGAGGARMTVSAGSLDLNVCGGTIAPTALNAGITASGISIAPGGTCTIVVPYKATLATPGVPKTFTNTIGEGLVTVGSDNTIKNQAATATVTVVDEVTVQKTASPLSVAPGNGVKYTLTVKNFSGLDRDGMKVADQLPAGLVAMAALPAAPQISGGTCSGLTWDLAVPNKPVFTIGTFPASGVSPVASTCQISFWAMVPTNAANSVDLVNIIAANNVTDGSGTGLNYEASNSVKSTTSTAVVALSKTFSPSSAFEGTVSILKIRVTNITGAPFTAGTLIDNLPLADAGSTGQMVIANPPDASTTCPGATVTAPAGGTQLKLTNVTVPGRSGNGTGPDGFCDVQVKIIAPPGTYNNVLPPGAFSGTQTFADNSTAPITNIGNVTQSMTYNSALVPAKSFLPATITSGGKSTVRVNLTNISTAAMTNVAVTDPLQGGMTVATPSNAYTTCAGSPVLTAVPGASVASASGLIVPPTGACDFLFDITASGTSGWTNTIPAGNVTAANGVKNITDISANLANSNSVGLNVANGTSPPNLSAPGQVSQLTVTITNNGTLDLSNVSLDNYFTANGLAGGVPTGMQVAATPGLSTNCPGGVVTSAADGSSVSLSNAALAHGASCKIFANITLNTANTVQNTIPVGVVKTAEGISNSNEAVSSLNAGGNIGVTKSFTPAVIPPGGRSRMHLTFINPVAIALNGLTVVDDFAASGISIVGTNPNALTTCTGAAFTAAPNATSVGLTGGSLPAAAAGVASTCYAEVDVTATTVGPHTNTINVSDVDGTIGGGHVDNPAPASAILTVRTPVVIAKSFNPTSVRPSVPSVVTITLTNPNAVPLTGANFVDNLPTNLVVAQTPAASMTCPGGVDGSVTAAVSATSVTAAGATIAANGACTVTFQVVSNIAATYTNTIPAGGLTTVEGVTNDTPATATLSLLDPPTVAKQFVPVSIPAGGTSTLTIVLGNTNATAVTLTSALVDTLPTVPGNIVVATAPNIGASTCTQSNIVAAAGAGTVTYKNGATIPAGGCTIVVDVTGTVVGNYNNFIPAGDLKTDKGNNPQPATANLAISPLGAISGKVFKDNSVNTTIGAFDGTDVGIPNVTIHLQGTETVGGAIVSIDAITDALGNYAFTGLKAGDYTVSEPAQPTGTFNGVTTAGPVTAPGSIGTATPVTAPSAISHIVLGNNAGTISSSPNNNFAEIVHSSISGNVFMDQDNSGTKDSADSPLANVTVELLKGGAVVATTTTNAAGAYSFPDLDPGTYTLREPTQPPSTVNGKTVPGVVGNGGSAGTATIPTVTPSLISNIVLPPGTTATAFNFAELPSGRQISGRVYIDVDTSHKFDNTDTGIANVTVNLTGTDVNGQPVTATTTTGPDGRYIFAGLVEGTYAVTEPTQPPRTTDGTTNVGTAGGNPTTLGTTPSNIMNIPMTGGTISSTDNNFGEIQIPTGTVSGKVYNDVNDNGVVNTGELGIGGGTSGVEITLTGVKADGAPFTATTNTDGSGNYRFDNVPPSNGAGYTITEIQPPLYTDGKTTVAPGNPGVAASGKPVLPNNVDLIRNVVVIPGDVLPDYNFGEHRVGGPGGLIPPIVNGYVFLDKDHDRERDNDGTSIGQGGWTVVLTNTTLPALSCTTTTDANGFYQFDNLHCPDYGAGLPAISGYKIAFTKDGGTLGAVPKSGDGAGTVATGGNTITDITLNPGDQVIEQNLPLDPSGVIYDSTTRAPVAGAVIRISGPAGFDPSTHLTTHSDTQTVGSDGFYKFELQDFGLSLFPEGTYTLTVTAPGGYQPAPSTILPACTDTPVVGGLPDPALVQASNTAPGPSVPQPSTLSPCPGLVLGTGTTQYYFSFGITHASADILNNHIPLDPMNATQILVSKTTPLVNVARGDLVPYSIAALNTLSTPITGVAVRDQIPPGFKYRAGSASLNGVPMEPTVSGRVLTWPAQTFAGKEKKVYRLILQVGSGVGDGKYVNNGWALNFATGFLLSNISPATVNVVPDPTFDCPDVIGKVFDDLNANGYQDQGEPGIPAARIATARGLLVMTDSDGRFHVPCPEIPNPDRGSNFVMKLDSRTLPSGYRITTENPRDIRLTRGKVSKLNFGATIHRVIRLELSDSAFLPDSEALRPEWQKQLDALPQTLKQRPSVVRLSYTPGDDSRALMQKRMTAIGKQIKGRWTALKGQYTLDIETEDAQ